MNDPTQPGIGLDGGETVDGAAPGGTVAYASPDSAPSVSPLDSVFNSTEDVLQKLRPGMVIAERFRLESPLGQGGMGVVWKATHLALQAPVAIKLLFPSKVDPEQAQARFLREARASAALRSAHIIQVFDYGVHEGLPYLVMELLEGRPLESRLEDGPMSFAETLEVMRDVCVAIGKAHANKVIHRDLKPANIFLVAGEGGERERAKVLDFGIAKFLGKTSDYQLAETKTGAIMGTPYYMSPEQLTESKSVDHRADLWSLGVIAYQCLTGVRPFESPSLAQLCVAIATQSPTKASQLAALPRGVDAWMAKALSRDLDERFDSADEMLSALEELSDNAIDRTKPSAFREVEFELRDDIGPGLAVERLGDGASPSRGAPSSTLGAAPAHRASPAPKREGGRLSLILIGAGVAIAAVAAYFVWPGIKASSEGEGEAAKTVEEELDIQPAPDDPPPVAKPKATGYGEPCKTAEDCGWNDPCAPTQCVAASNQEAGTCDQQPEPPGACECIDERCVLHPSAVPPAEVACKKGLCGLDEATATCQSGEMEKANEKRAVGPVCVCNDDELCEFTWVEPIACKSDKDCWVTDAPPYYPVPRPKAKRKHKFLPCKDGEAAPVCRDRQCAVIGYGCD